MSSPHIAWMDWPYILRFRKAGRKPVAGGRWSIRRDPRVISPRNRWKAWSDGKARVFSRRFATHAEAIEWAQFCARVFAEHKGDEAVTIIRVRIAADRAAARVYNS